MAHEEKQFIDDFLNADFKVVKDNENNIVEVLFKKEGEDTLLLCKSKLKKAKEQSMRNQAEERLDRDIAQLAKLVKYGQRVDPFAIERSIGRIKERHSRVSHYYEIKYIPFSTWSSMALNSSRAFFLVIPSFRVLHLRLPCWS